MKAITSKAAVLLGGLMAMICALPCTGGPADVAGWEQLTGKPYLVVMDRDTQSDAALRERLKVYFRNVNKLFGYAPTVVTVDPLDPAAPGGNMVAVRDVIKRNYREHEIAGVILLGRIPFMTWRQAAGITWVNIGPEDYYYADLDGEFLDQETRYGDTSSDLDWVKSKDAGKNRDNQLVAGREHTPDGQFETHLSGKSEAPQIWVARMYAPTIPQYLGYFDKVNGYYAEIVKQLAADKSARVVPFQHVLYTGHPDFPPVAAAGNYKFLEQFSRSLADSRFIVFGENVGGTVSELFTNYNSRAYLFAQVEGHACPDTHDLKDSSYTSRDVMRKIEPGHGALIVGLSGCHGGNFTGIKDGQVNLTLAYPLNRGITQAAYGCSWSGGIEEMEKDVLTHMGEGDCLGLAFRKTQNRLYSKSYMEKLFANEITHKPHYFLPAKASDSEKMAVLMTKLLRGHNLMGNPFLKIVYTNP
jgi:hypothetical protein